MPIPSITKYGAKQCQGKSKRTGQPCLNLAKNGWRVCRLHGARKSKKALIGKEHPNYVHGRRSKVSLELASKKSLMFLMLEEIGYHANIFPPDSKRTRGRKPNGFQQLDLNDPNQLLKAIELSMPKIK